jgi:hypothetical protein
MAAEDLVVKKLRTTAQEATGLTCFCWKPSSVVHRLPHHVMTVATGTALTVHRGCETHIPLHELLQIYWHQSSTETETIRIYEVSFHLTQKQGQHLTSKKKRNGKGQRGKDEEWDRKKTLQLS